MPSIQQLLDLSYESLVPEYWSDDSKTTCTDQSAPPYATNDDDDILLFNDCLFDTEIDDDDDDFDSDIISFIQTKLIPLQEQFNNSIEYDYKMTDHERQYRNDSLL